MLQVQAMWSPVPRILPSLALLGRYQAIVHQNVSERHGFARDPYVSLRSTTLLSCIGFERLGINCTMPQSLKKFPRSLTVGVLQTNVGNKRHKLWLWTAVNHDQAGILAWAIGDRSAATFKPLWNIVKCWHCFFYVTDGWKVYPMFIESGDQIVSKTAGPPRMHSRWKAAASPI